MCPDPETVSAALAIVERAQCVRDTLAALLPLGVTAGALASVLLIIYGATRR